MRKLILIFLCLVWQGASGQEILILDEDDGRPIPNVFVFNANGSKMVLSDPDGRCDLSSFEAQERITFNHIGYQTARYSKSQLVGKGKLYLATNVVALEGVVMSVSKWQQQRKDISQKITAINGVRSAFTAPQTSADLLANSGKVFVQKSQLGGGSPMIRGFATNRVLINVDGVRMNNAIFRGGNVQNIISLDPFNVRNTEILFGPGSVIYGSDAMGGVMNFYTYDPQFAVQDSLRVSGNGNYRFSTANNENTFHVDLNMGTKKWAFLSSATYSSFGDLRMGSHGPDSYLREHYVRSTQGKDTLVTNENPKKQVPTGYDQINFMQKIAFRPNKDWNMGLGLHYSETSDFSRYDRLIRPSKDGQGLRSAEWFYGPQKWFMGNLHFNDSRSTPLYDGLKIVMAYQNFKESRNDRDFQDAIRYRTSENVDALSVNVDLENKSSGRLRWHYGTEYVYNKVGSLGSREDLGTQIVAPAASRYPNGASWRSLSGYLSGELKASPNLMLLSGLRYSHVWIDAVFDQTFYAFPFKYADLSTGALTGSLGFSWLPKADLQITFNGATGFRAPNIDDVGKIFDSEPGSVVVPNPHLEPEYVYNLELGVSQDFKGILRLKGAAYYAYLVDALVRRDYQFNGEDEIMYNGEWSRVQAIQNAAKAYVYGFELGVEAFFTKNLSLLSNLTLTNGIEEEEDGSDSAGRHVAPTFGDVHLIWKAQKWRADFFVNYNGEVAYRNLALSERTKAYMYARDRAGRPYAPSWYTVNLRSQYQLAPTLKAMVHLENITDQRYRTYSSGIVAPGINLVLGLGYTF